MKVHFAIVISVQFANLVASKALKINQGLSWRKVLIKVSF